MFTKKQHRQAIALILVLMLMPVTTTFADEDWDLRIAQRNYNNAVRDFHEAKTKTDKERNLAVFMGLGNYLQSPEFVIYYQGRQYLENDDLENAYGAFLALGDFEDAKELRIYVDGRISERSDEISNAISSYKKINILDSSERLDSLRLRYPDLDDDLPPDAKRNQYIFIASEMTKPIAALGKEPKQEARTLHKNDIVQARDIVRDESGKAWVEIVSPQQNDISLGFIAIDNLRFFTFEDQRNYAHAIDNELAAPSIHYMRMSNGSVSMFPSESTVEHPLRVFVRPEIVQMLKTPYAIDNQLWVSVEAKNGDRGFILSKDLEPMSEEAEIAYRKELGSIPVVRITPIPRLTQTPSPVYAAMNRPSYPPIPDAIKTPKEREDRYYFALWLLTVGYTKYDKIKTLETAIEILTNLGRYKNSKIYLDYARLLLSIAKKDFSAALNQLDRLYQNGFFGTNAADLELQIPRANDIYIYMLVCEMIENQQDIITALEYLLGLETLDSSMIAYEISMMLSIEILRFTVAFIDSGSVNKPNRYPEPAPGPTLTPKVSKMPTLTPEATPTLTPEPEPYSTESPYENELNWINPNYPPVSTNCSCDPYCPCGHCNPEQFGGIQPVCTCFSSGNQGGLLPFIPPVEPNSPDDGSEGEEFHDITYGNNAFRYVRDIIVGELPTPDYRDIFYSPGEGEPEK
ncbi:hypothetical protein AGMMS49992_16440 [Clostridia bacterium]|nr:hypothetical protein AGMMS49992_16440 [Clostridia bacterium]